jgi:enoyl-CoA hydratase
VLDADEAAASHLLSRVVDPADLMGVVHKIADQIAAKSVPATSQTKALMRVDRGGHPQSDLDAQAVLFDSDDKRARMTAFLERKKK